MGSATCSGAVSAGIRRGPPKARAIPHGKSEEAIVAEMARRAKPAGAKGLCLSRASHGGGTA
jgi:hypothetical protein